MVKELKWYEVSLARYDNRHRSKILIEILQDESLIYGFDYHFGMYVNNYEKLFEIAYGQKFEDTLYGKIYCVYAKDESTAVMLKLRFM